MNVEIVGIHWFWVNCFGHLGSRDRSLLSALRRVHRNEGLQPVPFQPHVDLGQNYHLPKWVAYCKVLETFNFVASLLASSENCYKTPQFLWCWKWLHVTSPWFNGTARMHHGVTPWFNRTLEAFTSSTLASCWTAASFRENWIWMWRSWPSILHVDWRRLAMHCSRDLPSTQDTKASTPRYTRPPGVLMMGWPLPMQNDSYSYSNGYRPGERAQLFPSFLATGWWRTEYGTARKAVVFRWWVLFSHEISSLYPTIYIYIHIPTYPIISHYIPLYIPWNISSEQRFHNETFRPDFWVPIIPRKVVNPMPCLPSPNGSCLWHDIYWRWTTRVINDPLSNSFFVIGNLI